MLTMEVHKCSLWKMLRKADSGKFLEKADSGKLAQKLSAAPSPLLSVAKSQKNGQIEFCSQTPPELVFTCAN